MMKVNGPGGRPSSIIPSAIDLKFGKVDYVSGVTPNAKYCKKKIGPAGPPRHKGEIS